jgi:hypothetical protein
VNGKEDQIILCVLSGDGPATASMSEEEQTLRRLYTEVLGLLPHSLAPVEPRPEVRQRLLAAIREPAGPTAAAMPAAGRRRAVEEIPSEEATLPGVLPPGEATHPSLALAAPAPAGAPRSRGRRWAMALAAVVALAALGLAALLFARLEESRAELVRRERELAALADRGEQRSAELAGLRSELAELAGKLGLLTQPGVAACPLRPPGDLGLARGVVYIGADHQHWLLRVTGLPPVPPDRTYQLWFVTAAGPVSGGTFRTSAGADAELGSPTMPGGITAMAITVERAGGAREPSTEPVLLGNETMRLL